jgi:Amt family ammonium transporter
VRRRILALAAAAALGLAFPGVVLGADGSAIDPGDTAWVLMATALVMVMLPGLALFYGGLVRRKNVLSTIMHSFFGLAIVSVVWVLWGFTLAFGPDVGGFGLIGGLDFAGFVNVGLDPNPAYAATIPFVLFASFQLMFAAITPALITGAFAERKRFAAFVLFTILWSTFVYSPLAHWVWAPGGWLRELGTLDYAGGTVVHISSGVSALVVALLIGRRVANGERMDPHDVPMTVLGAGLLWFGWFGFNAGSALGATGQAANALLVTNTAAAAATIAWVGASYLHRRKASVAGAAAGAVAGLVAITPASGYVGAGGALIIGFMAGGICYSATLLRERLKVDDALDVFAVHGVGGTLGAIMTGVLAVAAIGGTAGLIEGDPAQVGIQLIAVGVTYAFAAVMTFVIVKIVELVVGLRVPKHEEELGLDLAVHGEVAYQG